VPVQVVGVDGGRLILGGHAADLGDGSRVVVVAVVVVVEPDLNVHS
jgi:hypothetical protein